MTIEQLKGLPAYGPMYIPFAPEGVSHFSEGFVLKINIDENNYWVANFRNGYGKLKFAKLYEETNLLFAIAQGSIYEVDIEEKRLKNIYSSSAEEYIEYNNQVFIGDWSDIYCFNKNGLKWRTENIGIDGIILENITDNTLYGQIYDPMREKWNPVKINIDNGAKET
jgi:hypothetical protein